MLRTRNLIKHGVPKPVAKMAGGLENNAPIQTRPIREFQGLVKKFPEFFPCSGKVVVFLSYGTTGGIVCCKKTGVFYEVVFEDGPGEYDELGSYQEVLVDWFVRWWEGGERGPKLHERMEWLGFQFYELAALEMESPKADSDERIRARIRERRGT